MKKCLMAEMTWSEIGEYVKTSDIVLLPFGSTEQHGPHLPLGVDTYIPLWLCEEISSRTGTLIAPPLWFSCCEWHMSRPGTVSLRTRTLIDMTFDICDSLYQHGFRNFICVNGHTSGSNPQLLCAADEIQKAHPDIKFWIADPVLMAKDAVMKTCECEVLYHADEVEASQMLVARPDLVHLERCKANIPHIDSSVIHFDYRANSEEMLFRLTPERWKEVSGDGNIGDPTIATKEKGQVMMDAYVTNLCIFIEEIKRGVLV